MRPPGPETPPSFRATARGHYVGRRPVAWVAVAVLIVAAARVVVVLVRLVGWGATLCVIVGTVIGLLCGVALLRRRLP